MDIVITPSLNNYRILLKEQPVIDGCLLDRFLWNLYWWQASDQFSGDNSEREPPDPFSNSEVKPFSADDSVALAMWK